MNSTVTILKQSSLHNKFALAQNENVTRTQETAAPPPPIQSADLDKTIFGVLSKSAMTLEEFNTRKNSVLIGLYNFIQNCKALQAQAAQAPVQAPPQAAQAAQAQAAQTLALAQDQANVENIIFGDQVLAQDQEPINIQRTYLAIKQKIVGLVTGKNDNDLPDNLIDQPNDSKNNLTEAEALLFNLNALYKKFTEFKEYYTVCEQKTEITVPQVLIILTLIYKASLEL